MCPHRFGWITTRVVEMTEHGSPLARLPAINLGLINEYGGNVYIRSRERSGVEDRPIGLLRRGLM